MRAKGRYVIVQVKNREDCPLLGEAIRLDASPALGSEHEHDTLAEAEAVVLGKIGCDELLIICDRKMRVRIR